MADEIQQPTRTEPEYLYDFGRRIPKSELSRIPLDMDPPPGSTGDQGDDDYWRWLHYQMPKLTGWLAAEEERRERLMELVLLASKNDDPEIWKQVDKLVAEA